MNLWTAEVNIKQRSVQQSTFSAPKLSYDIFKNSEHFQRKV